MSQKLVWSTQQMTLNIDFKNGKIELKWLKTSITVTFQFLKITMMDFFGNNDLK